MTIQNSEKPCEEWRPIAGFEAYAASDAGRVKRIRPARGAKVGRILKPKPHRSGYRVVDLSHGNQIHRMTVAHAVCRAFHGPPPSPKHEAAHGDGDPTNDSKGNVRWATRKENMEDADQHGRIRRGERHQNAKATDEIAAQIRRDKAHMTYDALAEKYGLSRSVCCNIVNGKAWV